MRNNKKEYFSNQNNNNNNNHIYKKIEKGESTNKNNIAKMKLENLNSPINNLFLYIFLVLSICLTTTLYLYYRFNSNVTDELLLISDVHKLKAFVKSAQFIEENQINIYSKNKLNKELENHIYPNTSKFFLF